MLGIKKEKRMGIGKESQFAKNSFFAKIRSSLIFSVSLCEKVANR